MSSHLTVVRKKSQASTQDHAALFWSKVEHIFGEIPTLLKLVLDLNGFDTLLALKGIRWDDKNYFFESLEETVRGLADANDNDELKLRFLDEMASAHYYRLDKFKLKMGHKNLIVNLCHELQSTNFEDFNAVAVVVPEVKRIHTELVVRKPPEEHQYSRETKKRHHKETTVNHIEDIEMNQEDIQLVYKGDEETESSFVEHEYLEELDHYEGEELVDYQEIKSEDIDDDCIYTSEQIVAYEADNYEHEVDYESSSSLNRSGPPKTKRPKHMYTNEFLQTQATQGRIGTPGRRRPKIQKSYPETDEGMLERWADLVRQSCQVIVPDELLAQQADLENIDIQKMEESVWEVKCPMCSKKLRLQLTQEGKYYNYKRSNFERHLRIVHYKQIKQFKEPEEDHYEVIRH